MLTDLAQRVVETSGAQACAIFATEADLTAARLAGMYGLPPDYARAIECYQEVVESGLVETEPRFFTSLVNLAVSCAKAGYGARCVELFADVASRFPARLDQVRALLSRKESFLALLQSQAALHDALRRQVPALFAA